jgi:hypothetical protein
MVNLNLSQIVGIIVSSILLCVITVILRKQIKEVEDYYKSDDTDFEEY